MTLDVMDGSATMEAGCRAFGLGGDVEICAEMHGGVNRVWRVRTEHREVAVHQLLGLPPEFDVLRRCAWVASLELAAINAGIRAPAPVLVPASGAAAAVVPGIAGAFTVHELYDALSSPPRACQRRSRRASEVQSHASTRSVTQIRTGPTPSSDDRRPRSRPLWRHEPTQRSSAGLQASAPRPATSRPRSGRSITGTPNQPRPRCRATAT